MPTSLRLRQVHLKDVGRFHDLMIAFRSRVTVICGANGVGKTSVLDALATSIVGYNTNAYIRRRADQDNGGYVTVNLSIDGQDRQASGKIDAFYPEERFNAFGVDEAAKLLIYLRAHRDFSYVRKESIRRDVEISDFQQQARSFEGVNANEIKDWFANRYLMRPHGNNWPKYRKDNLETASKIFRVLDSSIDLHGVDTSTFDINVITPAGIIPYEYLSSGFRSAFSMLLGIIKELEYRKLQTSAADFDGVILIDEIDLHLHPSWQSVILHALRTIFSSAQIIVSTHSPHVVQTASADEVVSLSTDDDGDIACITFSSSRYGFSGWTIEEILSDVMGVTESTTPIYRQAVSNFDLAVEEENSDKVKFAYAQLMEMLHPSSPLRKVFALQASQFLDRPLPNSAGSSYRD